MYSLIAMVQKTKLNRTINIANTTLAMLFNFLAVFKALEFLKSWVVYMCSNLLQLAHGSRDLSQTKKRIMFV